MTKPKPFTLHIPEPALIDLRARLERTRWPDEPPLEAWSSGTGLAYLQELVGYWKDEFDWRAQETRLNELPQFTVPIAGIDLHFIHVEGRGSDPLPLLLAHGWPGSVVEFLDIIPLLTEHFTVVAPSLPGYTLSFSPGQPRFGVEEIADCFAALMTDVLGYRRFGAQGGDWGAFVASRMAARYPGRLAGIHLNLLALPRDTRAIDNPTDEEQAYLARLRHFAREETGYQWIQGTKPQTLAYGLTDSPAGLAAWIVEKFRSWSDCGGDPENAISRDDLLANISLYWFTGAIGSSFWPYYARRHRPWPIGDGNAVGVPLGYAQFPREIVTPPRSLAEKLYTDIRRWTAMERGGHFAALEQPEALAREVIAFFEELK